jgi:hypothetical protein
MSFSQLLQNLGSYLDLSKRLVTTVPGLVMAVALVLLTGSVPDWALRAFVCGERLQTERRAVAAASRLDVYDRTRPVELQANGKDPDPAFPSVQERLNLRSADITLTSDYGRALAAPATCRTDCEQRRIETEAALKKLQDWDKNNGAKWLAYQAKVAADAGKGDAAARQAGDDSAILRSATWDLARDPQANRCVASATNWTDLAQQFLLFGLLGFALGMVFDPINRALFLQVFPDTVAGTTAETDGIRLLLRKTVVAPLRLFVSPHALDYATERRTKKTGTADPVLEHAAQFYIGRGLITNAEYQDLVDRYYRFSELSIGLVLPLVAIGTAVLVHERSVQRFPIGIAVFLVSGVAAIAMARLGSRSHVEFKRAVRELIQGRLAAIAEQRQRTEAMVDLTQLHLLTERAAEIMALWVRLGSAS